MSKGHVVWLGVLLIAGIAWSLAEGAASAPAWEPPVNISNTPGESRAPALAVDSRGVIHVVWEEGQYLYHSYRAGATWSTPRRIFVGEQPALAIDHNDVPYLIYVNEFRGNYEIYFCQWTGSYWTLPRNVSQTSGVSAIPDVAVDRFNTLYVVWTDNSPGYNVIYYGQWTGVFWINRPIPQAKGSVASIAIGGDDLIHVVWQSRDSIEEPYEIYHAQWDGQAWSLPENLSDSQNHSTIPDIAVSADGVAHVVWEERINDTDYIYYCGNRSLSWSVQEMISEGPGNAYLPSVTVDAYGFPHVAWDASDRLAYRWRISLSSPWSALNYIARNGQGIADVALYAQGERLHAVWAERAADTNWDIYYSSQPTVFVHRVKLPLVMRR